MSSWSQTLAQWIEVSFAVASKCESIGSRFDNASIFSLGAGSAISAGTPRMSAITMPNAAMSIATCNTCLRAFGASIAI